MLVTSFVESLCMWFDWALTVAVGSDAGWWPAHWEPQEEGVMNIAARFSLS
jgi:hypothetical protein